MSKTTVISTLKKTAGNTQVNPKCHTLASESVDGLEVRLEAAWDAWMSNSFLSAKKVTNAGCSTRLNTRPMCLESEKISFLNR